MSVLNLNNLGSFENQNVRIFTKPNWASPWVLQPYFHAEEIRWVSSPDFNVATLQWRYGEIFPPNGTSSVTLSPITTRGYYVLILFPIDDDWVPWLGYAESAITTREDEISGTQVIPCYGLERVLGLYNIGSSVHVDPADENLWKRKYSGGIFNAYEDGNRSKKKVKLDPESTDDPSVYAFANPHTNGQQWWTTRTIVEHLFAFHLPTTQGVLDEVPWAMTGVANLPTWDRPTLATDNRTLFDCFEELLSAERLLGWKVEPVVSYDGSSLPSVTSVNLDVFTTTASSVTLPSVGALPSNEDQIHLVGDNDELLTIFIDTDDSETVDQIIVEGPPEIGVGTFVHDQDFENGWSSSAQLEYSEAGTLNPNFDALSPTEKRELNAYLRDRPFLDGVYRFFPMKTDWGGLVGPALVTSGDPLFWRPEEEQGSGNNQTEDLSTTYVPFLGNCRFLGDLPLFAEVDYSVPGAELVENLIGKLRLPILAFIPDREDATKLIPLADMFPETAGLNVKVSGFSRFGARITPYFNRGPGFELHVSGAPRHAIDPTFTGNSGDPSQSRFGGFDYREIVITAAMQGDRRPKVFNPVNVNADFVRQKVLRFDHESLQMVHLAKNTIVDLDSERNPVLAQGVVLRNPLPILAALSKLAATRYLEPRYSVRITSHRMFDVRPGQMIRTTNGTDTKSIIREVRVFAPVSESENPVPLRLEVLAHENEIDVISLMGRVA